MTFLIGFDKNTYDNYNYCTNIQIKQQLKTKKAPE